MKHQAINPATALPVKKDLNTKTITLRGRITRADMFSIMRAMNVGDTLYITHALTARNASVMSWHWPTASDFNKEYQIEEYPGCYCTVERTL